MALQYTTTSQQDNVGSKCNVLSSAHSLRTTPRPPALAPLPTTTTTTTAAPHLSAASLLPSLLILVAVTHPATVLANHGGWHQGRATHYGGPDDWWNINEGSCGYGYLDKDRATGWDIVALADTNWDYANSCGRCVEVRCQPSTFTDGYGESLDRTDGVCRDPDASVIVQVTDTCPCNYPSNSYSNRRWCCGDMYHLDLSTYAFEKLAENRWGVIGVIWRPVACDYEPERRAPVPPEGESLENLRICRPWGWTDKRPWP